MAKTKSTKKAARKAAPARKAARKSAAKKKAAPKARVRASAAPPLKVGAVRGADRRDLVGGVILDIGRAGNGRIKRMIYPAGFRWSRDMQPIVGTEYCMHAHVGFLVQGEIHVHYADGCVEKHKAPQIVAVAPGHDGRVVGNVPAVMIEFDFEKDTAEKFGMPSEHRHD
jgi:hypothetical protein